MPPKRKRPSAPAQPTTKPAPQRRSKLAKENNITTDQEAEIREAFSLFSVTTSDSSKPFIATSDIRRCLIALNTPPSSNSELADITSTLDPENEGWIEYENFVAVAALKLQTKYSGNEGEVREEVVKAFGLFTRGEEREIGLGDLRRVAKDLREDVPESVLRDMLREATGGGTGGVGLEEFEGVMRRAGVFG